MEVWQRVLEFCEVGPDLSLGRAKHSPESDLETDTVTEAMRRIEIMAASLDLGSSSGRPSYSLAMLASTLRDRARATGTGTSSTRSAPAA